MNFDDRYGPLDRLLHRVAFRAGLAQRTMAEVEEALWGEDLQALPLDDPVFITALPRCGTTILLEVLVGTGRFASHTYRDMPFVLCPLLWERLSRSFAVDDAPVERAHGDGLEVSADSPEAFEEMVWKHFWPDHYREDRIRPWTGDDPSPEFAAFFETHMRKVVVLRRDGPGDDRRRYVSKNNLNVARLAAPPGPMREGTFVIPFREPVQQAASMLRQHRRFLELHELDPFVREYMEAIGHHEFGQGLKPVDFGGWLEEAPSPERLEFWVRYWIAVYRWVLEHADGATVLVSYRRLTEEPEAALGRLARAIDVPQDELVPAGDRLRPPRTHDVTGAALPDRVQGEAEAVQGRLERGAEV
ncbi:MAG: hypothetical protein ACOC83_05005 [Gemmatimonadota bacterium]